MKKIICGVVLLSSFVLVPVVIEKYSSELFSEPLLGLAIALLIGSGITLIKSGIKQLIKNHKN